MLPWRQAILLPFDLGGKIKFIHLNGSIEIIGSVSPGIFKIGFHGSDMFPNETTVFDLKGKLILKGRNIRIGTGSLIRIEENGICTLGNNSLIGARSIILCETNIDISSNLISAWNCQLMDTDTHSIQDIDNQNINTRTRPIKIEDYCWLGNNVILNKGTVLPSNTIVASYSLCNKDYSKTLQPFSIIGGIPAKILAVNKKRMNDKL